MSISSRRMRRAVAALALLPALSAPCGCERTQEILGKIGDWMQATGPASGGRSADVSDHERIVRKFGAPREKLGMGIAAHTENGMRYDRKWNYYYPSPRGAKPEMRTVYFLRGRYVGSVLHQPDGKIRKETIRFAY